jgi:putative transposon-encoded protein
MAAQKNQKTQKQESLPLALTNKVRFEVYGDEMVEKIVKLSGNSGRVYLPPDWVGKHVKIIRMN